MNYQNLACWGDSQTFGARTYGCFPLYLAEKLNKETRYLWRVLNLSANGSTARSLWFRLPQDLSLVADVYQACVLIGANDVGNESPLELFEAYYRQILDVLRINRFRVIFCGEIPPIRADGHAFFSADAERRRAAYNERIHAAIEHSPIAKLVKLDDLEPDCFVDPVHLTEAGNRHVAERFAQAVMCY
jgi:lysophospholipase L1-like esterase